MKLDKKQGYGHISGDNHGAAYEQDGRLFDANGDEIVVPGVADLSAEESGAVTEPEAAKPAKGRKKKVADSVVQEDPVVPASPVDSQLAAQGL